MSHYVHVTGKFAVTKVHKLKVVMHVYSARPFKMSQHFNNKTKEHGM